MNPRVPFLKLEFLRRFKKRRLIRFWYKLPPWVTSLIVIAVLGATAFVVAKPGYAVFRKWRVSRNLDLAIEASKAGDALKARDLALSVITAGDTNIETLRVLESSMHELYNPEHLRVATILFSHPECSEQDRLTVFKNTVMTCPVGFLQSIWSSLPPNENLKLPFRLALADRLMKDQDFRGVLKILEVFNENQVDVEVARRRIRACIGCNSQKTSELAQERIVVQWKISPENSFDWCELLEMVPIEHLDPWILDPMLPWLGAGRPATAGRGELMADRIHWVMSQPTQREKIVTDAIGRWRGPAPVALAGFLTALGQHEKLVETLTLEAVGKNPDLIKARVKSLIRLGRDAELAETLELLGSSLRPVEQMANLALAAHRINDAGAKAACWQKAIDAGIAEQQPGALLELSQMAAESGMGQESERAFLAAIKDGRGPLPVFSALTPLLDSLTRQGLDVDLIDVINKYLVFEPWNPQVNSRYCYLAGMLGLESPAGLSSKMEKVIAEDPEGAGGGEALVILATLQLLSDQLELASGTWRNPAITISELSPSFRAAYLATEVLSGKIKADDPEVAGIPWESLLPCERNRLRKLLRLSLEEEGKEAKAEAKVEAKERATERAREKVEEKAKAKAETDRKNKEKAEAEAAALAEAQAKAKLDEKANVESEKNAEDETPKETEEQTKERLRKAIRESLGEGADP